MLSIQCTLQFGGYAYHLYLLYYGSKSINTPAQRALVNAYMTNRTRQLAAQSCHVTLRSVRHIVKKSHDAQDVNLDMMNAYLDDGVDYFLLLFPHLCASFGHDLQLHPLRSVILGRIDCT